MSEKAWEYQCPKYVDFGDPNMFLMSDKENDAYFENVETNISIEEENKIICHETDIIEETIEVGKHSIKKERRRSFSITIPVSPKLRSAARARTHKVLGPVETNVQPTLNNKSTFKATPLNKNIFKHNFISGLPKSKLTKACTKALQMSFSDGKNDSVDAITKSLSNTNISTSKPDNCFVTPLPPPPLPKQKSAPNATETVAHETDVKKPASANCSTAKRPVQIKPFSFVNNDIAKWTHREATWKEKLAEPENKFEFKAQPMPVGPPRGIPEKTIKPLTKVRPFHSDLEERAKTRNVVCDRNNENVFHFHARPCKVTKSVPFKPMKMHHTPVKCMNIRLRTELRARQREMIAQQKKEAELAMAAENERRKAAEEEETRETIRKLRASLVHKPLQFKKTKPFTVKYDRKPVNEKH